MNYFRKWLESLPRSPREVSEFIVLCGAAAATGLAPMFLIFQIEPNKESYTGSETIIMLGCLVAALVFSFVASELLSKRWRRRRAETGIESHAEH